MSTRLIFIIGVLCGSITSAHLASYIHTQQLLRQQQPEVKEQTCVVEMQHRGKYGSPVKLSIHGKVKP